MQLLSFPFAIFVGLALLLFHLGPARWRPALLLGLSYVFYLSWSIPYTLLLAGVTAAVYLAALWIEGRPTEEGKRAAMGWSVAALVALLFGFKSADGLLKVFAGRAHGPEAQSVASVIVPLGLSYYLFKLMGYLLDVYWEVIPAQRKFVSVALYGAFFPQIVSGPIQRAQSFFGQMTRIEKPEASEFTDGLRRILVGLVKKVVIADTLAIVPERIYANVSGFSPLELLAGAYCFAIQLYMDLSGLTDIAIGIGQLFGVKGPENFDLPYLSANIQLFWRRWHMSLTTWLTDYLFTPLRMTLRNLGTAGLCLAVFINLVAIGLWHGLTWKFVVFGMMHGIFVIVSILTLKWRNLFFQNRPGLAELRKFAAPVATFHLVVFSLIFFRAGTLASALQYVRGLVPVLQESPISIARFDPQLLGISPASLMFCAVAFLACEALTWAARQRSWAETFFATPMVFRKAVYGGLIVCVLLLFKGNVEFIYARF